MPGSGLNRKCESAVKEPTYLLNRKTSGEAPKVKKEGSSQKELPLVAEAEPNYTKDKQPCLACLEKEV